MLCRDCIQAIESIAPPALAADWDNVGLILGDPTEALRPGILLTIDLTRAVLAEADRKRSGLIVAYHPPLFSRISRLTDATGLDGLVLRAARAGIALYSPHTALDATVGGMADWLANLCAADNHRQAPLSPCAPLVPARSAPELVKIVTFVPTVAAESVRRALAKAGAGVIGAYTECSFSCIGEGTFRGGPTSKPRVGKAGVLETVMEQRVEMVCPRGRLAEAVAALRQVHPYEEPPLDVVGLETSPTASRPGMAGSGRVGVVAGRGLSAQELAARVKGRLGLKSVQLVMPERTRRITRIAVCPGAGESLIDAALRAGCEGLVTGEMKHHEQLRCARLGLTVVLAGHTETERGYLPHLRDRLSPLLKGVKVAVSAADRPPTTFA